MGQSIQEWTSIQKLKLYGRFRQIILLQIFLRLSSTNFTWSILECFLPNIKHYFDNFIKDEFEGILIHSSRPLLVQSKHRLRLQ